MRHHPKPDRSPEWYVGRVMLIGALFTILIEAGVIRL